MGKLSWLLGRASRTLMAHVSAYAILGLMAALAASVSSRYLPWPLPLDITVDAIDSLLTIIATSMLTVTIFAIGSLTSAYALATSYTTARAMVLLTEDDVVQGALATFVGTFLFGIVGLVALKISAYGPQGRAVMFVVTLVVISLIVLALLRLIEQLTKLGQVVDTAGRIELATYDAMKYRLKRPFLGGRPLPEPSLRRSGANILADQVGYVQYVDAGALAAICTDDKMHIDILVLPGSFVYEDTVIAVLHSKDGSVPSGIEDQIRDTFAIGATRSYDQDPRFGLVVLTEVALRALSPAINDPGTAIDVIGRQTRLLTFWGDAWDEADEQEPVYPQLSVPPLNYHDMFEDAFNLIGRDGAGHIDVMLRLLKSLSALTRIGPAPSRNAARHQLELAYGRAMPILQTDDEKQRLTKVYTDAGMDPLPIRSGFTK